MGNEVAFHLSGGVFFNLMLAARKKPVANQNQCLKELLYIYDRSAKEMAGNSLVTIASRFRNCDPDLHSDYIRFGDPVVVEEFNGRMRDDYASVVDEVKNYADHYLDLEVNGKWLVRALMELVEKDSLIQDNAKFMAIPGGLPAYKQEFPEMQTVYIYNMLLGVWHFICCRQDDGENGQETYFKLSDYAGESRPRKLNRGRIGFKDHENMQVSYDIEIEEKPVRIERPDLKDIYKRSLRGEVVETPLQSEIYEPIEQTEAEARELVALLEKQAQRPGWKKSLSKYWVYLSRAYEKHSKKKTFLYEIRRDFYGFFVCNDVKRREKGKEEKKKGVISEVCVDSFREERCFAVLSGTGGMGKSMMMTHFMLDTIKKNQQDGQIPVFVLLRDYNPESGELLDFIFGELKRHDVNLHLSDLVDLLQSGKGVILFDGLDEIKREYYENFYKEMELLVDNYPNATYIVSSRPTMNFRGLSRFTVYDLQPFSQDQAVKMVEKLDQSVVDPEIQKDFIEDLKNNRFGFDWEERMDFLGNPLFLTILLLSYEGNHDIPTERYLFYEQAYDAMARKHDAAKALTREFATGLNSREFQLYFGEFCTLAYEEEKYDFTQEEMDEYFKEVIDANELKTTPEDFIKDITEKICLIYKDGEKYYFVHRSFQEYFVAYFFSRQLERRYGAILDILVGRDRIDHDSVVLPMLFNMENEKTELCIFIPFLERVFCGKDEKTEYKDFLEYFYPFITYGQADSLSFPRNVSDSSIYQFIAEKYSGIKRTIDGNELPVMDFFVEEEFFYCNEPGADEGDYCIMRRKKLPDGYEDKTEVEIIGREYMICVEEAYRRKECREVVKMLEDESFPLKQEYRDMKKLYLGLKAKYAKKTGKDSFRSRFH